jgi:hypothetical protein
MPPEDTILNLKANLPEDEKKSSKGWKLFFVILALFVVVTTFARYYFWVRPGGESIPATNKNILTDAVTGKPIPEEIIRTVSAEQKANKQTFVFSGSVVSVEKDIVSVKSDVGIVKLALSLDGKILRGGGGSIQEKLITSEEIQKGNFLTVVFPEGKTETELLAGPVMVKNVKVFSGVHPAE